MAGRRIRWANAGRAAAIAAAVLAALASLPALVGSDEPPPLPEDVGIGQVAPPPPTATVPPPPVAPVPVKPPRPVGKLAGERTAKGARPRKGGRESSRSRNGKAEGGSSDPTSAPAVPYVPGPAATYTSSFPPAPPRREFHFER